MMKETRNPQLLTSIKSFAELSESKESQNFNEDIEADLTHLGSRYSPTTRN